MNDKTAIRGLYVERELPAIAHKPLMTALMFLALFATFALSPRLRAQTSEEIAKSQMEAVRLYPALGIKDSDFNKAFVRRVAVLRSNQSATLLRDDWPVLVAKAVALELASGGESKAPGAFDDLIPQSSPSAHFSAPNTPYSPNAAPNGIKTIPMLAPWEDPPPAAPLPTPAVPPPPKTAPSKYDVLLEPLPPSKAPKGRANAFDQFDAPVAAPAKVNAFAQFVSSPAAKAAAPKSGVSFDDLPDAPALSQLPKARDAQAEAERLAHDRFVGHFQLAVRIFAALLVGGVLFQKRKAIFTRMAASKRLVIITAVLTVAAGLTFALIWLAQERTYLASIPQRSEYTLSLMAHNHAVGTAQLASGVLIGFAAIGFAILKGADTLRFMAGKWQTAAGAMTVALLLTTWLYPPWIIRYSRDPDDHCWGFLFSGDGTIDVQRLVLLDLIVVTLGGSIFYALRRKPSAVP